MAKKGASSFEDILSVELAEVDKRRESRKRDLTQPLTDSSAGDRAATSSSTTSSNSFKSSPLYPSRRPKHWKPEPAGTPFQEFLTDCKDRLAELKKRLTRWGKPVIKFGQFLKSKAASLFGPKVSSDGAPAPPPPAPPPSGTKEASEPEKPSVIQNANAANLFGLAFSGGGIRSATFNLGVLQGLARRRLLHRFDYLSTISGGGYIGAWLTAWIHRRGMHEVETRLGAQRKDQPLFKEPPEIGFLREYSNYLTPRKGILGADTWTAVSIYLRNLILNQLILILFIAFILLIPRVLTAFAEFPLQFLHQHPLACGLGLCCVGLAIASYYVCNNMLDYTINPKPDRVLARVLAPPQTVEGDALRVRMLNTETHTFDKLFASRPRAEIWDQELMIRRTASAPPKLLGFTKDDQAPDLGPTGTMRFNAPVSAEEGDLVIAVYPKTARPGQIFYFIALPTFLGAIILARLLAHYGRSALLPRFLDVPAVWTWVVWPSVAFGIAWLLNFVLLHHNLDPADGGFLKRVFTWPVVFASPFIAGGLAGFLLWKLALSLQEWGHRPAGMWEVIGFGGPIVALILLVSTVIQIGLLSVVFSEPRREWWGRVVGILLIMCFVWVAVFFLAGYAPFYLILLMSYPKSTVLAALAWAASTALGVFGGKSAQAGAMESKTWKDAVLSVTPYVFIVGLLMLVSLGIHKSVPRVDPRAAEPAVMTAVPAAPDTRQMVPRQSVSLRLDVTQEHAGDATLQLKVSPEQTSTVSWEIYWDALERSLQGGWVYVACLLCFMISFVLAMRVDLNEFSMHYLYRNRLVRCYLGASNRERVPNPFTGFDVNDDVHLAELISANSYEGPLPIFGAALNLVHGKDLAWQERKAESFAMTPHFSGFDVWFERSPRPGQLDTPGLDDYGYRPTGQYAYPEGFYVGTAMAISGAAASPNMGFHSSPALGFLMTVFNVRLGWWVGNPRHPRYWRVAGPWLGLGYLLLELFGGTDDTGKYVYLSDGGHFENLGLYELVKRRCRFILVSDAGADKSLAFDDLGSAIRKCRSDMGIEIKLKTDRIFATGTPPFSKWHCTIADICYSGSDQDAKDGTLVYIKSSLTSDEPADVLNYKSQKGDFPHQSTADQWFTESQFESYRALGQHIVETVLHGAEIQAPNPLDQVDVELLFTQLKNFWNNPESIQATRWPPDTGP
jgi:patatin-like phospholipase